jgi:hypothetical protein
MNSNSQKFSPQSENFRIVQAGLDILLKNIKIFMEETLKSIYGTNFWIYLEHGPKLAQQMHIPEMKDYNLTSDLKAGKTYRDVLFYLNSLIKNWETIKSLFDTNHIISLCHEIKYFRNKWAHQSPFTLREVYRFLDSVQYVLEELKLEYYYIDCMRKAVLEAYYKEEVQNAMGHRMHEIINHEENSHILQQSNLFNDFKEDQNSNLLQQHCNQEDLEMIDSHEIDIDNLYESNYQKIISTQTGQNSNYSVTLLEDECENSKYAENK